MYFANMYCYGWDHDAVGITGIRGCLGAVYKGAHALYAVHIPPTSAQVHANAAQTFAGWVRQFENNTERKGDLWVFINGKNRSSAEEEAKYLKSQLNAKHATLYRLMQNLGPDSGGYDAHPASILVRQGANVDLLYKHVPSDQYVAGGRSEVGQYMARAAYQGNLVPPDHANPVGWHIIDGTNSVRVKIK